MTDGEILDAVEGGLRAQGDGQAVIEPRVHLVPDKAFNGHFNILRGYLAPLDATAITDMRTGAMTALGAKYLARKNSKVLGHIGARGSSYWNVRLLDHLFDFREIRVHSRRKPSREGFGARLEHDLGKSIVVTEDWESCIGDADIVVEASRLKK